MLKPPPRLIALDPGYPDCGVALFHHGRLVKASWCRTLKSEACPLCVRGGQSCEHGRGYGVALLCDEVEREMGTSALPDGIETVMVAEWVTIYHRKGERVDPRGLFDTASVAGAMLDRGAAWGAQTWRYTAPEWKGNWPKEAHQQQGLCHLSPEERGVLPRGPRSKKYLTDPLDAALLGEWWLVRMRMRERRVYARARDFSGFVEKGK